MKHKIVLQYHCQLGGWVNICVTCGKVIMQVPDCPIPEPDWDYELWDGQPEQYRPELDCEAPRSVILQKATSLLIKGDINESEYNIIRLANSISELGFSDRDAANICAKFSRIENPKHIKQIFLSRSVMRLTAKFLFSKSPSCFDAQEQDSILKFLETLIEESNNADQRKTV